MKWQVILDWFVLGNQNNPMPFFAAHLSLGFLMEFLNNSVKHESVKKNKASVKRVDIIKPSLFK